LNLHTIYFYIGTCQAVAGYSLVDFIVNYEVGENCQTYSKSSLGQKLVCFLFTVKIGSSHRDWGACKFQLVD
jgi:hypothetical protein